MIVPTSSFGKNFTISEEKFKEIMEEKATPVSELLNGFESQFVSGEKAKELLRKAFGNEEAE